MKFILNFSQKHPIFSLLFLMAITAIASTNLSNLRFDISAQSMMIETDPAWELYQRSLNTFGSDNNIIIFIQDPGLFNADKLLKIKQTIKDIEALSFVTETSSLFNTPNVKEIDEYIITEPYLKNIPSTDEEAQKIIKDALNNPLVANNLISLDAKTMAINVSIDSSIYHPGLDHKITTEIENTIKPLQENFSNVFQMGAAYIRESISTQIKQDQNFIVPAALLTLVIILGVSLKHINCSILPIITAGMSIVLTLSIMAYFGLAINILTSIVPALLLIIGSTEDIHLMTEYQLGINQGLTKKQSVAALSKAQSLAITLTFFTTFIGFLSIMTNELALLREFGMVVSLGLLLNFLITALFVPAFLCLFGSSKKVGSEGNNIYQNITLFIFKIVIRFKKTTLVFITVIALFFGWGAQFIKVNNNTLEYFQHDSDIYQRAQQIHQHLSGMQTFSIILDSGIEGTFEKTRYLDDIYKLQQHLKQMEVFDQSFSFADFMMLTNKIMEGNSELSLPIEDEILQSYLALIDNSSFKNYVSNDFSSARILVRHNISSSHELSAQLDNINYFLNNTLNSNLNISFTGESVLTNRAADQMAISQIQSLILMMIVILLLVSVLFIDLRAGILALIPNVFPVIVLFGVMGYFNIPLDTGTTMVAIIALGICVDDTIHFLSRYHQFTRGESNAEEALLKTAHHEATPITTTSIALACGFASLTLSSFQPVVHFGALSALVMLLALFSTFVLTPILLSYTRLITAWDMMTLQLKKSVTKDSAFFHGLTNYEIKKAVLSGEVTHYQEKDIIIEQGSTGSNFYVILEGGAKVTHKDTDGSIHTIGSLNSGDLFGEVSQLTGQSRTARVMAQEYTKALKIKWSSLYQLGRFNPRISLKLYRNLSMVLGKRMAQHIDISGRIKDELTGAVTKPFLLEQLQIELERSKRHVEPLSCIILDVDFLISSPDKVKRDVELSIKELTQTISFQMRNVDVFARWGNQQFIIVMPRTTPEDAERLAQRIKNALDKIENNSIGRVHLSVAITSSLGEGSANDILYRLESKIRDLTSDGKSLQITKA